MFRNAIAAAIGSLALAGAAQAGLVTFKSDKADFTGAVQNMQTSTLAVTDFDPEVLQVDLPVSISGLTIPSLGASFPGLGTGTLRTGESQGRHAVDVDGNKDTAGVYIEGTAIPLVIAFQAAVQAFAFWGVDIGDFDVPGGTGPVMKIELFNGSDTVFSDQFMGSGVDDASSFYGFVGSATSKFDRVVITNLTVLGTTGTAADGQGFSQLMIADAKPGGGGGTVPVPGVLALTLLGLAAAGVARRQR